MAQFYACTHRHQFSTWLAQTIAVYHTGMRMQEEDSHASLANSPAQSGEAPPAGMQPSNSLPESGNMRRSGGGDQPLILAAQPSLECSSEPVQAMKASAAALVASTRPVKEVPLK